VDVPDISPGAQRRGRRKVSGIPKLFSVAIESGGLKPVTIYAGITFIGSIFFLSDILNPDVDGKDNGYNQSRRIAYELAKTKWINITANKALGAYEILEAKSNYQIQSGLMSLQQLSKLSKLLLRTT
jgi:hypothetical protein